MRFERDTCLGVLTHVDQTIVGIQLDAELHIVERSADELVPLLGSLEFLAEHEMRARLEGKYRCITHGNTIHLIEGDLSLPYVGPDASLEERSARIVAEQAVVTRVERYVELMKLFKDSSVDLVLLHLFKIIEGKPTFTFSQSSTCFAEPSVEGAVFSLSPEEAVAFRNFCEINLLPFHEPFLQLAYENYLQSYRVDD